MKINAVALCLIIFSAFNLDLANAQPGENLGEAGDILTEILPEISLEDNEQEIDVENDVEIATDIVVFSISNGSTDDSCEITQTYQHAIHTCSTKQSVINLQQSGNQPFMLQQNRPA